jgi:hypothetical protein
MLDMLPHLLCRLPHLLGIVHCLLGISGALVRYALTQFLDDEAHLVSRAAEVRFKLSHTLFKQNHALFELAEPVRSRLMLLLCRCLAPLLAGLAHFLGYLTHGFPRVTVFFRVFAIALGNEPLHLRPLYPFLALRSLWFRIHGVSLCTRVRYPIQVGDRKLALNRVHHVVQGLMIAANKILRPEVLTQLFGDLHHVEGSEQAADYNVPRKLDR